MLPKHRSVYDLEPPFQRAYFENEFGSRSIGEPMWKPHIRNAQDVPNSQTHSIKGGNGLDWFSSIRCLKSKQEIKEIQKHRNNQVVPRTPQQDSLSLKAHHAKARATNFGDNKRQQLTKDWELSLEKSMGQRKKVQDCRNGFKKQAPGDKSYYVPECAAEFHRHGSTLPLVSYGDVKIIPDTFIPLVKLPLKPRIPFHIKEQQKEKLKEIWEVTELDNWKPADKLCVS